MSWWALALICLGCLLAGALIAYVAVMVYLANGFRWLIGRRGRRTPCG